MRSGRLGCRATPVSKRKLHGLLRITPQNRVDSPLPGYAPSWSFFRVLLSGLCPESAANKSIRDLAITLQESEQRLREWRHSSARAGADEALAWVLSWYEKINLDALVETRGASAWLSDPTLISKRQERAFEIAKYADTRAYIAGDDNSEPEDEEEDEAEVEGSDADAGDGDGAAESEGGGDEDEPVDEDIQIDQAPTRNTGPDSENQAEVQADASESQAQASTDESLKLAAEIAAQAASEAAASNPDAAA